MKVGLSGSKTWQQVLRWHAVAAVASAGLACGRPPAGDAPVVAQTSALSSPSAVGQWSNPITLTSSLGPIVPIHMAVLKNSRALIYGNYKDSSSTTTRLTPAFPPPYGNGTPEVFELDPTSLAVTKQDANGTTALFCGGLAQRSDGSLVSVGGSAPDLSQTPPQGVLPDMGIQDATALTPGGSWTQLANMNNPRWYPSLVTLPAGELMAAGGTYGTVDAQGHLISSQTASTPEVFRLADSSWHPLNSVGTAANAWFKYYPWLHVLSDGVVFYSGASAQTSYLTTAGTGTIQNGPARGSGILRDYGTSVMYEQDQILVCGGGSQMATGSPENTCGYINLAPPTRTTAAWQNTNMTYNRKLHNATILADGQVLVTGGSTTPGTPGSVRFEETWSAPAVLGDVSNKALQVAVAPFSDGRLDVYMIGLDHQVWHRYQDSNMNWQPSASPFWQPVGTVGADDLSVARLPDGTAEVAIVDHTSNHNLWHSNVSGLSSTTMQLIGTTANMGKRVIMAPLSTGQLDAYMVGIDYNVWHALLVSGQWQWSRIGAISACPQQADGSCARPMAVTRRSDDTSEVVIIDGNKNLYHDFISPAGEHGFQLVGNTGNKANQIGTLNLANDRLDVYMVGIDGRVWHLWQTTGSSNAAPNGAWASGFVPIGTESVTVMTPVRLADGHTDVYVVNKADGFTYHTNGDYAPTYLQNSAIASPSGAFKLVDNTVALPTQLVASPYVSNLTGQTRLDSRPAVVQLASNQSMYFAYQPSGPVFTPELWNPSTKTWTTMAAMQIPRTYHSTAVLLPDGRVLSAGGGAGGNEPDHPNAEIFSPPYLFVSGVAQPTITSAPSAISYGTQFSVTTSAQAANVRAVTLVGLSATTHTFNAGQHFNSLPFTVTGTNTLTVTAPANNKITPEAYYMLFVLDRGVPSVAKIVQVH